VSKPRGKVRSKDSNERERRIIKAIKKFHDDTIDGSLGIKVARQNPVLQEFLTDPRGFFEDHDNIMTEFGSIEKYSECFLLKNLSQTMKAKEIYFTLVTYRTIEAWKHLAQSYLVSATLLNQMLIKQPSDGLRVIKYRVEDFGLPFSNFFVDLGVIDGSDQHVGVFVNKHKYNDMPKIDMVLVDGNLVYCFTLDGEGEIKIPAQPNRRNLIDPNYTWYVLISMLYVISGLISRENIDVSSTDTSVRTEWQNYLLRPGEKLEDFITPIWSCDSDARTSYSNKNVPEL